MKNLEVLILNENKITDIWPLSKLTNYLYTSVSSKIKEIDYPTLFLNVKDPNIE